jgi:hypothetical protein
LLLLAKPAVGLSLGVLHQPNEMGCAIGHVRLNCAEHATNYQAVRSIPRREPALPRFRRWVVRVAAEPVPGRVQRAAGAPPVAPVARVRPGREPDPELPGREPDLELPGREPDLELPGRVRLRAEPVPAGGLTLRAPSPR